MDPDRILEADLLRWLLLMGQTLPQLFVIAAANLTVDHFRVSAGRNLYDKIIAAAKEDKPLDLPLAISLESPDQQLFMAEVLQKKSTAKEPLSVLTKPSKKCSNDTGCIKEKRLRSKFTAEVAPRPKY